jgi:hypothetical protein
MRYPDIQTASIENADKRLEEPRDFAVNAIADYDNGLTTGFKDGAERMLQSLQDYRLRDERIKEEWLRNVLKDALPPIKGKITKGKLKWRGIKLHIHTGAGSSMYEVMQRGVRLGLLRVVDCQRADFSREIFYIPDNPKHIPKDIQGVGFFATPFSDLQSLIDPDFNLINNYE